MKFQKLTRGGLEYRIYASSEDTEQGELHGAIKLKSSGKWKNHVWTGGGKSTVTVWTEYNHAYDLLPEKKRRFKTAQELVNCYYGEVSFYSNNRIVVKHLGEMWSKVWSDTPEGNYPEKWLNVFTTTIEEDI